MRDDLNLLVITKLDPNGAAKRSGMVQENDCLLRVGGVDAKGMSAEQVMPLLKGSVGTKLRLRLSREQDEIDLTLLRAEAGKTFGPRTVNENATFRPWLTVFLAQ
jgi:C-terminal processing protease CtpA/Prc